MLEGRVPPPTPAHLGCDADPVLDGWVGHCQVIDALRAHRAVSLERIG